MDPFTTGVAVGAAVAGTAAAVGKLDTEKKLRETKEQMEKMQREQETTKTEIRLVEATVVISTIMDGAAALGAAISQKKQKEEFDRRCDRIEARLEQLSDRLKYYRY